MSDLKIICIILSELLHPVDLVNMQSLVSLTFLILATAISAQQTRELVIDAGNTSGTFKNLQGKLLNLMILLGVA